MVNLISSLCKYQETLVNDKALGTTCVAAVTPSNEPTLLITTTTNQFMHNAPKNIHALSRNEKLPYILHAEAALLQQIAVHQFSPHTLDLYIVPMPPCEACAKKIVESGVITQVNTIMPSDELFARWGDSMLNGLIHLTDAGIGILWHK